MGQKMCAPIPNSYYHSRETQNKLVKYKLRVLWGSKVVGQHLYTFRENEYRIELNSEMIVLIAFGDILDQFPSSVTVYI